MVHCLELRESLYSKYNVFWYDRALHTRVGVKFVFYIKKLEADLNF